MRLRAETRSTSNASPAAINAADSELKRAATLHRQGRWAEAEKLYRNLLKVTPNHFRTQNLLGILMHFQGRNVEALEMVGAALRQKPNDTPTMSNYGAILSELNRLEEALATFDEIISLDSDNSQVFYNRGVILQRLNRIDAALPSYEKAISLKPSYAEAFNNRGLCFKELKRFEEALASFDQAIALKPDFFEALNNRGLILYTQNRLTSALASYDKAIAISPSSAEAFNNRGVTLQALKRLEEAFNSYETAIGYKPTYADAFNNAGNVLKELKRFDEALTYFDKAILLNPNSAEAYNNRGTVLSELEQLDDALASYNRAIDLQPDNAEAFNNRGNILKEIDKFDEALADYDKAITLKLDYAEALNNSAIALVEVGRFVEARHAAERAVNLVPRNGRYYHTLGNITQYKAKDPRLSAMETLAEDVTVLPVDERVELHFALAKAYEDLAEPENAFSHLLTGNALKRAQIQYDETKALETLNVAKSTFTAELVRNGQNFGIPSSAPVFIIGMPRSGSTLVEQILASHPDVRAGGELKNFRRVVIALEKELRCSTNSSVPVTALTDHDFCELGDRYLSSIRQIAKSSTRTTDKMTGNFHLAGLIHLSLPNAAIIHTIRDPIDTCVSCFSTLFADGALNYTYNLGELGRYYRNYKSLMAHWNRVLPAGRILEIRYEDVVADLEGQTRRILEYCGLKWAPRCLNFYETRRPVRTASATQVRRPIYNSSIGRWRFYEKFLDPLLAEINAFTVEK
jgi:tetratricopeptide (TPR) repeat protein